LEIPPEDIGREKRELKKAVSFNNLKSVSTFNIQDVENSNQNKEGRLVLQHSRSLIRIPAGKDFAPLLRRDLILQDIEFIHPNVNGMNFFCVLQQFFILSFEKKKLKKRVKILKFDWIIWYIELFIKTCLSWET
jgi:hypothetical protein